MKQPPFLHCITRSHPYWKQKQSIDLHNLKDMKPGDILLDPFCRQAVPTITALLHGAKVFAADTHPVALFLLKVLIQPVGLFALKKAFEEVQSRVALTIQKRYTCACPECKKKTTCDCVNWVEKDGTYLPDSVKITCRNCGCNLWRHLSKREIQRQLSESKAKPEYWYPEKIKGLGRKEAVFTQELFTKRNLTSLAELLNAINKIQPARCRETLQYVFTAILNRCITTQNFRSASCGWDEFKLPSRSSRQEQNIWNVFKKQFAAMITCKAKLNSLLGFTGISNSMDEFLSSDHQVYVSIADLLSSPFPRKFNVTHVFVDNFHDGSSDRSALLEFWGSWLKMNSAESSKRTLQELPDEEYFRKLRNFLLRVQKNTDPPCKIISTHKIRNPEFREAISNITVNQRTYDRICLSLIQAILFKDNYFIKSIGGSFHNAISDGNKEASDFKIHDGKLSHVDFIAENREGRKIFFCFYSPKKEKNLKKTAEYVFQQDRHEFQIVCYLVFPNKKIMRSFRHVSRADIWPRGFYVCFEDICKKAAEIDPDQFGHLLETEPEKPVFKNKTRHRIKHCRAEVIENMPVGFNNNPMHFKMQFTAPDMHNIGPGQFVMVDALPESQRKKHTLFHQKQVSEYRRQFIDLSTESFLKRPFGIQRAYYKHFEWGYHKKLKLPAQLATITNTVYPHQFEIFYKIIENGTGTNELKKLQAGSQIKILGPLGKFTNIPKWRSENIDEVHLIGGGVGMAPLVFFGQALKFYSFKLKAFIGIDRIESLKEIPYGKTYADESEKAYVYIHELSKIGLNPDEIFLSRESVNKQEDLIKEISPDNYHTGLVTDLYKMYLIRSKRIESIMILACGPKPMLTELNHIALQFNIPMKVLLEKRMGCGIGVCMSCVCRTQKGSERSRYSRVCVEGPLFDATEIDWEKL